MKKTANEIFIKAFGKNLRKIRLAKEISMQNLAYSINVEYSQISRIELGKINTSVSTAYEIAKALEVPVQDLFNFEVEEK
ncbi:MAG: helix-turn-helix transcriptional regulator [Flavobacterium sp.]|uniref:helix-turn-helix transcriptional regulator n=1 Tax=Flavobacterium sp. TaxID=239 RepID=UPI0022CC5EF6|nr:helix-turn-helix transcriptional regulator [Flavobacterium sp.]MCZ8329742.1 helix-turn-helix transcriptional regulator [Flavobacterium sp.]